MGYSIFRTHLLFNSLFVFTCRFRTARAFKRKLSDESESSQRSAKKAKSDVNKSHPPPYHRPLSLSNIALLHNPLTLCFKYLTVKELLRVSMTCKYLNCVASDSSLVSSNNHFLASYIRYFINLFLDFFFFLVESCTLKKF